jgi:hypothetical protein
VEINSVTVHRERETQKKQGKVGKIKQAEKGERQRERGSLRTVSHYWAYSW